MTQKVEWGPVGWVEQLVPHSAGASVLTVAGDPSSGLVFPVTHASRTSDGGGIADIAISVQDESRFAAGAWGRYTEAWVLQHAHKDGTQFGHEYAAINLRTTVPDLDPININIPGSVVVIKAGVGKPGANGQEVSATGITVNAEGFANPNAIARKGWIFHKWGHKYINGLAEVLSMAKNMVFRWYDDTARVSCSIQGCVDNADHAVHFRATNGAFHFLDEKGVAQFSFNCKTGALYLGTGSIGPNGTIRVFVGGVPYLLTARKE